MKVLVLGGGGREHALVWKLSQSPRLTKLYCAPGNPGMAGLAECVDLAPNDFGGLLQFAEKEGIDSTFVGPEAPLAAGIVDLFQAKGLKIFGPTKEGAKLESSKSFTKAFCARHHIPTAAHAVFDLATQAETHLKNASYPLVIKADGLAAGKGVSICKNEKEALQAVHRMMVDKTFGEAGARIVVEEFLEGEEASFMVLTDGKNILPLSTARDHKRLLEGNLGPNTGGMGAYSPAPNVSQSVYETVMETIIEPTLEGLQKEGIDFVGVLYAGLMLTRKGPFLLEYNVRLGDPEAQVILPRLKTDWIEIMEAAFEKKLDEVLLSWEVKACACVVMAAQGYPFEYEKGNRIQGLQEAGKIPEAVVFHAGTKFLDGNVVTNGGRVLGVSALGEDLSEALKNTYAACSMISWKGHYYRKDIGREYL